MMNAILSSRKRSLRQRWDGLWSRLQAAGLQIPLGKAAGRTSPTWEVFSERFDRCFRRVSFYVSRRVSDRETLERIVTRVLVENRELFIAPCEPLEELKRLKASADRLLALEAASNAGGGTGSRRGCDDEPAPAPIGAVGVRSRDGLPAPGRHAALA